jgi:hypothetical protein
MRRHVPVGHFRDMPFKHATIVKLLLQIFLLETSFDKKRKPNKNKEKAAIKQNCSLFLPV